jgi:invasion protein IalB
MNRSGTDTSRIRRAGRRAALGAAAALALLAAPVAANAQQQAAPPVKRTAFDNWYVQCRGNTCAAATQATRAVVLFGYNVKDGSLVMQVRLPTDAPAGRPMAIRLHKSGALLHFSVNACAKTYCLAAAAPDKTEKIIQLLSKEPSGTLGYQLGQQLQLEVFSLKGFTKAITELRKHKPR